MASQTTSAADHFRVGGGSRKPRAVPVADRPGEGDAGERAGAVGSNLYEGPHRRTSKSANN
jgi:hypothetical protein